MPKHTEIAINFSLNPMHSRPMYWQLADHIRTLILRGKAQAGDGLPSPRKLAGQLGCSLDTVKKAYDILLEEGFLATRRGARHIVQRVERFLPPDVLHVPQTRAVRAADVKNPKFRLAETAFTNHQVQHLADRPLAIYSPNMGSILEKEFLRLASHLARTPRAYHYYSDPAGLPALREVICRRLRQMRGILCEPGQVIITNGTLQSVNLVAQLLFEPHDEIWLEDPTLDLFAKTFNYNGLRTVGVPVDEHGFSVRLAMKKAPGAKGVLVTPASQTPMSVTMPESRRRELLDWALEKNGWIIEDDTDNLMWLNGTAIPPLRALPGAEQCVIYLESFSLQFSPGIKLAYMLVPKGFEKAFIGAKLLTDRSASESTQALLAKFFESEGSLSYSRKLHRQFIDRYEFTIRTGTELLGEYGVFAKTRVGPHLAFLLRPQYSDREVCAAVQKKGVIVRALSQYWRDSSLVNGLSIGFGTFTEEEIRGALLKVAQVCETLSRR